MDSMSAKQWKRVDAVQRIQEGALTVVMAAKVLGLSSRQVRRLLRRFENGEKSLAHGNAGRSPAHRHDAETRKQVVALMRGKYAGFNDQHFTEKLAEHEGLKVSRSSVQRILRKAGLAPARKRR